MKSDTLVAEVPPPQSDVNGTEDRAYRSRLVSERLGDLTDMEDGWFEGRGFAPSLVGLHWLNQQLQAHYIETDLPLPRLFPTEPGGVYGEWSLDRHVCGIEIDLESKRGSWFDIHRQTHDGIDEQVLDLDSAEGWRWLIHRLGKFAAKGPL